MSPSEFVFLFVYLPWACAFLGVGAFSFTFIMGGSTLRTIIMGKLDKSTHYALGFSDGGGITQLKRYHFDGTHGILEAGKEYVPFTTPLSDTEYTATPIVYPNGAVDEVKRQVDEQNAINVAEAKRRTFEMGLMNEMAKKRATFEGRPFWLLHLGVNAAEQPSVVYAQQKAKERKGAAVTAAELISVDTIKDFMSSNFSRDRLWSIFQKGRDVEAYGRPKKPFNPMLIIIAVVAAILILVGALVLSGQLDFTGWLKGMGVMK